MSARHPLGEARLLRRQEAEEQARYLTLEQVEVLEAFVEAASSIQAIHRADVRSYSPSEADRWSSALWRVAMDEMLYRLDDLQTKAEMAGGK